MARKLPSGPWRTWSVKFGDYEPSVVAAPSRAAARYSSFLNVSDAISITFGEFVRRTTVRPCPTPGEDGYAYVRSTYGVEVRPGYRVELCREGAGLDGRQGEVVYPGCSTAHVHVILDGERYISRVHPRSIKVLAAVAP